MVGTIELDRDGHSLLIRFTYREDLVDEVRALPERRWDKGQKVWRVPSSHAELVVSTFMRHGFSIASEVTSALAGTQSAPTATATAASTEEADATAPWSVRELNTRVRSELQRAFPTSVRVFGEIADFDKGRGRKHSYFTLVDKGSGDQRARVEVALFERTAARVLPELERHGLTLRDGVEILVEARVDLYPGSGRFQLVIDAIRPEFTLGKLALSREQILAELRERGAERLQLELPMPVPALRIGVLASPDSDGWNDFLEELSASGIGFSVALHAVAVQGAELRPSMLRGLAWFAARRDDFDVVCIVRGGGSRTDLAWFDDLDVALAVALHPLKIVCGIGHQRDQSVLDLIAHSEKTPTAAAARLVTAWREAERSLAMSSQRLADACRSSLSAASGVLASHGSALQRSLQRRLFDHRHALLAAAHRVERTAASRVQRANAWLRRCVERMRAACTAHCSGAQRFLEIARFGLRRDALHRVARERDRLDRAVERQRLLDPRRVIARGYALVRDAESNRIVTDAARLRAGARADVYLRDGRLRARVESIDKSSGAGPDDRAANHGST